MLTQAISIVYEAAITNLIDLLCFLFFILDICGAIFVYHYVIMDKIWIQTCLDLFSLQPITWLIIRLYMYII